MVLFKTNLLEVFEDHLFVLHLEPMPANDIKQVNPMLYLDLNIVVYFRFEKFRSQ